MVVVLESKLSDQLWLSSSLALAKPNKIGDIAKHIVANTKANKGMNDRLKCPYFKLWPKICAQIVSKGYELCQEKFI